MSQDRLLQTINKIPLFNNLSPGQVRAVVRVCSLRTFQEGEDICTADTPSDELYERR